jgi:hypothetical protein
MKTTSRHVTKGRTLLSAITMLLISISVVSPLTANHADAQTTTDGCKRLPIDRIGASHVYDGYEPKYAADMNIKTGWASDEVPAFIQADLKNAATVCSVDISWYQGDSVKYRFVISTSADGITFRDVASGVSSGQTISPERYNIPDTNARYVRVTVNGNDQYDWAVVTTMSVNGYNCNMPTISGLLASGNQEGNIPQNTLDNNLNTRWSNLGLPSSIQYDLGESQPICSVDISWYRGNMRVNAFTISVSNDGINYQHIFSGQSSGKTVGLERYDVPDTMGKYLRITVTGNTENSWSSITEVRINGGAIIKCKSPQISGIAAIGNDGNVPENTLDNNLNTRWSNLGLPSWIQYDLGESQPICSVDISWYRGNMRVNAFTISVSNDGINFTPIFSGQSSGKTVGLERYDVPDTMGKYLRITVTGNTENSWSSITEVRINDGATPAPTPTPTPDPDPTPDAGTDSFGIKKIYPTKADGEEWFMDMNDGKDPRSIPPSLSKNSDGSFKVTSTKVRYGTFTSSGYDDDKIETLDHSRIAEKGYMQSPNDWRDVELTGYVKVNSGDPDENFAWYARGGRHTGSGSPEGCEGVAYKADLGYDGRVRFAKEQWHVSYVFTDHKRAMSSIEDKWVGFKGIMYNIEENGATAVKMEIWLDKNNDGNWVKVDENIDRGGWGDQGEECGGEDDQIITWGGPVATFRWDGATNVDIKNFSVREIEPPS